MKTGKTEPIGRDRTLKRGLPNMGELNRSAVKLFHADDPDFEEKNMMVFEGTPSERWKAIRDVNRLTRNLRNKAVVPDSPLRRDVVRMYTWSDGKEPPETK